MQAIDRIIEETPYITDLQKTFYKTILTARKERILDYALGLLQARDPGHEPQAYNRNAEQER
jgi:hypothetical protein